MRALIARAVGSLRSRQPYSRAPLRRPLSQAHLNGILRKLNLENASDDVIIAVADGLEELELSSASRLNGHALEAASKLHSLTVCGWHSVSKRAIAAVAGRIRTLKLPRSYVSDDALAPLAGSTQLLDLDISGLHLPRHERARVSDAGLKRALAGTRIRSLNLSGRDKLTGSFLTALAGSLETLDVSFCSSIAASAVMPLAGRLHRLAWHYSGIRTTDLISLSSADRAPDATGAAAAEAGRRSHEAAA